MLHDDDKRGKPGRMNPQQFTEEKGLAMTRSASVTRKTKETDIKVELDLDGSGRTQIRTGIPFMDHMLNLMAVHGFMDLSISASGDIEIDNHHTVEDLGICLGKAIGQALGKREGIRRYGHSVVPMDEALARAVIDISNRPFLAYNVSLKESKTGTFDVLLVKEFFRALVQNSAVTLHVDLLVGEDAHHAAESIFKAFARAFDQASGIEPRLGGAIPSTKGIL
jgi:imidazoleglycerol-phosphate dehydratase